MLTKEQIIESQTINHKKGLYRLNQLNWTNILFFGITGILAVVGLPLYAYYVGLKPIDWILFAVMAVTTMMATTFGHHRLFAHRSFKVNPVVKFLNLFFGAGAFEGPVLTWASQHRTHHRYTDTARDPYNIKFGFWHAHMGWFLFHNYQSDFSNAKDLRSDKLVMHQYRYWIWWAIASGIALPLVVGLAFGSFWGAFFLAVCGRMFFIHHSVFFINSACHYFGKPIYDKDASARDSLLCAILTHGEGYHSFHHRFPSDYRNGIRWYQWDPTKWMVKLCSYFGWTWDLMKVPEYKIQAARSETEQVRIFDALKDSNNPKIREAMAQLDHQYELLKEQLTVWESKFNEYKTLLRKASEDSSSKLRENAAHLQEQLNVARAEFFSMRKDWVAMLERHYALATV